MRHRATSSIPTPPGHLAAPTWAPHTHQPPTPSYSREPSTTYHPPPNSTSSAPSIHIVQPTPQNSAAFSSAHHESGLLDPRQGSRHASPHRNQTQLSPRKSLTTVQTRHKRALDSDDDDDEVEQTKKSRVERKEPLYAGKRGAKRNHDDDDQSTIEDKDSQRLDKRARKFSGPRLVDADGSMDVDSHDEGDEMDYQDEEQDELNSSAYPPPAFGRGRKRDRAEAGSTFGGDEDDRDYVQDLSEAGGSRSQSRVNGRRKRHHAASDIDATSSRSSSRRVKSARRRRHTHSQENDEDEDMDTLDADSHNDQDMSDEDDNMSVVPETPGRRRAGEEWRSEERRVGKECRN